MNMPAPRRTNCPGDIQKRSRAIWNTPSPCEISITGLGLSSCGQLCLRRWDWCGEHLLSSSRPWTSMLRSNTWDVRNGKRTCFSCGTWSWGDGAWWSNAEKCTRLASPILTTLMPSSIRCIVMTRCVGLCWRQIAVCPLTWDWIQNERSCRRWLPIWRAPTKGHG